METNHLSSGRHQKPLFYGDLDISCELFVVRLFMAWRPHLFKVAV